jgi:hypothetical protein
MEQINGRIAKNFLVYCRADPWNTVLLNEFWLISA